MTEYTLEALAPKEQVLARMLNSSALKAKATVDAAMKVAAGEVEAMVIEAVLPGVEAALTEAYEGHCLMHGDESVLDDNNADEWHSAVDDCVDEALQPWASILSANWLGEKTIDSRLHEEGAIHALAESAAMEAYREIAKKRKPGQILSAIGIVKADVEEALMSRATDSGGTASPEDLTKEAANALAAIIDAYELLDAAPDILEISDLLDLASDTDDGLARGAAEQMGVGMEEAMALRNFRLATGGGAETLADMYITLIDNPTAYDTTPAALAVTTKPKPSKAEEPTTAAAPSPGELPSEVLKILKEFTPVKDKDMGDALGMSRASFNNKCNGKGDPVTDAGQIAYIRGVLYEHNAQTAQAIALIDAMAAE